MSRPTLDEIEKFFNSFEGGYSVILPDGSEIKDIRKFARAHLDYCRGNHKNKGYLPYYERLEQAMLICK